MQDAKTVVTRFYEELINERRRSSAGEILAQDFRDHPGAPGVPPSRDGLLQWLAKVSTAFPDLRVRVDDLIAEGDKAAARITISGTNRGPFLEKPPTDRAVTWSGIDLFRLVDGRIAERWSERDLLGLMQQLGMIPNE